MYSIEILAGGCVMYNLEARCGFTIAHPQSPEATNRVDPANHDVAL